MLSTLLVNFSQQWVILESKIFRITHKIIIFSSFSNLPSIILTSQFQFKICSVTIKNYIILEMNKIGRLKINSWIDNFCKTN